MIINKTRFCVSLSGAKINERQMIRGEASCELMTHFPPAVEG